MTLHSALKDLEYPCSYPFKLICQPHAVEAVRQCMIVSLGDGALITDVHQRASRNGNYIALTMTIEALCAEQIEKVYADLQGVNGIVTSL